MVVRKISHVAFAVGVVNVANKWEKSILFVCEFVLLVVVGDLLIVDGLLS